MKTTSLKQIIRTMAATACSIAAAVTLAGCGAIFDDDPTPCEQGLEVRFIYDYNLERANAFPAQVDCLTLHIYDADGKFVETHTETTGVLSDEDYRMRLDLPAGDYRLIAYGGAECDAASFHHTAVPAAGSLDTEAGMRLDADCLQEGNPRRRLHDHFYGSLRVHVEEGTATYTRATVRMMKNTNYFRIMLQHLSYEPLDGRDYEFSITDDNTLFDHRNELLDAGEVTYTPWDSGKVTTGSAELRDDEEVRTITQVQMAYADLSTSRLMMKRSPRLSVKHRQSGEEIISLPLKEYLLALRSGHFDWTGEQEFLDRKSDWQLFFFLDSDRHWNKTYIRVDNWIVRINEINM